MAVGGDPTTLPGIVLDHAERIRALEAPRPSVGVSAYRTVGGPSSYATGGFVVDLADVALLGAGLTRLSLGGEGALETLVRLNTPDDGDITIIVYRVGTAADPASLVEVSASDDLSAVQWSLGYQT